MAYYNQDRKKEVQPKIKALLKEYNLKGSLSVRHHSTVVLTIKEGDVDFEVDSYQQVNTYHLSSHYEGKALEFLQKALRILNEGNHDNSDSQTDYFDVGWYVDINIGSWDKPYIHNKEEENV